MLKSIINIRIIKLIKKSINSGSLYELLNISVFELKEYDSNKEYIYNETKLFAKFIEE